MGSVTIHMESPTIHMEPLLDPVEAPARRADRRTGRQRPRVR
jgi:hypothetical protein